MIDAASTISKIIISSRHENLNFNVNEILSMYINPTTGLNRLPQSYEYDNKIFDIGKNIKNFKSLLAPNLEKLDSDGYNAMYASYIMGMYEDGFYNTIINGDSDNKYYFNDSFSRTGYSGFNKEHKNGVNLNGEGYLLGLNSDYFLSEDKNRRNLAWAIQDTGALTNYLLLNNFDGGLPGDSNSNLSISTGKHTIDGPSEGTNFGGYAWYNDLMLTGSSGSSIIEENKQLFNVAKRLADFGIDYKNSNLTSQINEENFNETGALFSYTSKIMNVVGGMSLITSMFDQISTTQSGAIITGELLNNLLPILPAGNYQDKLIQAIAFSVITGVWDGFNKIASSNDKYLLDVLYQYDADFINDAKKLDQSLKPIELSFPSLSIVFDEEQIGYDKLFNYTENDIINKGSNAKIIVNLIDRLISIVNKLDNDHKKEFINSLFSQEANSPFAKAYELLLVYITNDIWEGIMLTDEGNGGFNLLKLAQNVYNKAADESYQKVILDTQTKYKNQSYREMSINLKRNFLSELGYNGVYLEKSILGDFYQGITNPDRAGQKEFQMLFSGIKDMVSDGFTEFHTDSLQYLTDDKFWNISKQNLNTTSNTQIGGTLKFTLEYSGKGDSTSTASKQFKEVDVPRNFNPYQTIIANQTPDVLGENNTAPQNLIQKAEANFISGKVLGVEQGIIDKDDVIKYDGFGRISDLQYVNFKYDIEWQNISSDRDNPFWVITKIESFDSSNRQFYNIY